MKRAVVWYLKGVSSDVEEEIGDYEMSFQEMGQGKDAIFKKHIFCHSQFCIYLCNLAEIQGYS